MAIKNIQSETKQRPKLRFSGFSGAWEEKLFGDVFSFRTTNSFSRENLNYEGGEVKNIHYGDIHTKFKTSFDITKETVPFINNENKLNRIPQDNYCKEGDLILADASEDYADIGKCIEIIALNSEKVLAGLHTLQARPTKNLIYTGFGGYLMKTKKNHFQIMKIAQGTKVLSISTGRLANIVLNFPALQEQQKIAEFLGSVDEWIENLRTQKESFEAYKKGIMQKIFSQDIRFKDDKGNNFPKWEEKKLGDIFKNTRGHVLAMPEVVKEKTQAYQYPVYSSQTKNNGLSGYYKDFLFRDCITWTTDGANAGDVKYRPGKFYCTNVCGVLENNDGYANVCVAEIFNQIAKKYVSYVGNPKLMNNVVSTIKIFIPGSIGEQQKIADFLVSIDKIIESKQQQITQAEQWKKGLMQGLFV